MLNPRTIGLTTTFTGIAGLCLLASMQLTGCAVFHRSEKATLVEDEVPPPLVSRAQPARLLPPAVEASPTPYSTAPADPSRPFDFAGVTSEARARTALAPQTLQAGAKTTVRAADAPNPKLEKADWLFNQAQREQSGGALAKAAELWKQFLDQNLGLPGYNTAVYSYGYCLYYLGRAQEALDPLKNMILETQDSKLINDARILLAESLLQVGENEEALATTFDVLPNLAAEQSAGLERSADAVGVADQAAVTSLTQKIRLYTIRGRIFASLKKEAQAHAALEHAKQLLLHSKKGQISPEDMRFLSGNYAWRQLEVQALTCQQSVVVPDRLSEAEFLAYADAYYGCASPARHLYCTVLAARNEQVRSQAQSTYRGLIEAPLEIRNHLPPPAREIRKKEQRSHYESEMKALIEKTVSDRAKEFKDLPSCHAHDVF